MGENKKERILVMNIGSTSSKIAVFDDDQEVFSKTIRHTREEMAQFDNVLDEYEFRKEKIFEALAENNIPLESLTCACSRGGNIIACPHGAIKVDQAMVDYLTRPGQTSAHASLHGSIIANELMNEYGIPALVYDAIGTDEMIPLARVSGVPEIPHFTVGHTLNTRAMGIKYAEEKLGKKFDECTFIIAHLGGGSSIRLYKDGVNIDAVNDGDAYFTPERGGGVDTKALVRMCFSGKYTEKEMARKFHGGGGLKAHLNTADGLEVEKMIEDGDEYAKLIYEAMAYELAKSIGTLAVAVDGKVDAIILTGGSAKSKFLSEYITKKVSWIAPVEVMAGEFEMEALAGGALRVLRGEEEAQDFGEIAASAVDRIRIFPGVEPYTAPAKYFE